MGLAGLQPEMELGESVLDPVHGSSLLIFGIVDIGGDKIYPGSSVNVNWMGVWYDGTVIKIGPQNNLYKVSYKPIRSQQVRVNVLFMHHFALSY